MKPYARPRPVSASQLCRGAVRITDGKFQQRFDEACFATGLDSEHNKRENANLVGCSKVTVRTGRNRTCAYSCMCTHMQHYHYDLRDGSRQQTKALRPCCRTLRCLYNLYILSSHMFVYTNIYVYTYIYI